MFPNLNFEEIRVIGLYFSKILNEMFFKMLIADHSVMFNHWDLQIEVTFIYNSTVQILGIVIA